MGTAFDSCVVYARRGGTYWEPVGVWHGIHEHRALDAAIDLLMTRRERHVCVVKHGSVVVDREKPIAWAQPVVEWTVAEVYGIECVEDLLRIWADYDCANEEVPHAAE